MESARPFDEEHKVVSLRLTGNDFQILEKFRGELSHDAFISALLRMIDSSAVMTKPEWVKIEEAK
jgi:hypothetical protein